MRAIVHIGTEKTGTSTIQLFLRQNRSALEASGYHFLQCAGKKNNWALPAYCVEQTAMDDFYRNVEADIGICPERFREEFLEKFENEIQSLPKNIHTVLISSEHFHSRIRTDNEMNNVREFLARYFDSTSIICYLREQAETCASLYSQAVKSGNILSFHKFLDQCKPNNSYFNYLNMLDRWERYFGSDTLDIALFDRHKFLNESLVDDFIARLDSGLVGKLDYTIEAVNESLMPMGQALNRALNIVFPITVEDTAIVELRRQCKELIARHYPGKGQQIDYSRQVEIYESFRERNEALRARYFPELDVLFPAPARMPESRSEVDSSFLRVVNGVFDILEGSGHWPKELDDHTRLWTAITRSVSDVIDVPEGVRQGGVEVVLNKTHARTLRRAALRSKWHSLQEAEQLLTLSQAVSPRFPGINQQLQEYRDRLETEGDATDNPRFLMTYHGENDALPANVLEEINSRFADWLAALDIPGGFGQIIPLNNPASRALRSGTETIDEPYFTAFTLFRAGSYEEAQAIARSSPYIEAGGHIEVYQLEDLS